MKALSEGWLLRKGRMSFDSLRLGRPGSSRSARKSLRSALIRFLLIGTGLNLTSGKSADTALLMAHRLVAFAAALDFDFFAAETCDGFFFITSGTITESSTME